MAQQPYLYSPAQIVEDDIYNVTPQQTGVSYSAGSASQSYNVTPQQTGMTYSAGSVSRSYNVTPQQTGISHSAGSASRHLEEDEHQRLHDQNASLEDPFADHGEKPPALPPRRSSSRARYETPSPADPRQVMTYQHNKERVLAYMLPLPAPHGADGQPVNVPQRFMLYLPPAPDRLKPPPDSGSKERKRDKAVRKWQAEVRKAKSYNGTVVSFSGLYCASIRGAVYCLSLIKRSDLTFLSRLPRATLRELLFLHPGEEGAGGGSAPLSDRRRFELVMEEFHRNKSVAKRDFWIGAVVLPFAQAVDIAIPVGGGFSEVTLVWMILTGSAWKTASGMIKRLALSNGDMEMRSWMNELQPGQAGGGGAARWGSNEYRLTGAGRSSGAAVARQDTNDEADLEKGTNRDGGGKITKSSWWKPQKNPKPQKTPKPPVETGFQASEALAPLSRYLQAACHARNTAAFPDVGAPDTEAGVLTSIGWAPTVREHLAEDERAADVAWQIRQATEDLREAVAKAAKSWDKFCDAYVKDPGRALREEEEANEKRAQKEEKEMMKRAKKEAK